MQSVDKKKSYIKVALWLVVMLLSSQAALAQDSLTSVLQQVVKQKLIVLEYREVKHIVYLQEPIEVSGRMFLAGETFVLEQLQPTRQLLAADKHRFRLYIPDKKLRYSKMITSPQVQKTMLLFRPLMSGDVKALKNVFGTQFTVMADHSWVLTLTPKDIKSSKIANIRIQGRQGKAAHSAVFEMLNGSTSEWFFRLKAESKKHQAMMEKLLAESKG